METSLYAPVKQFLESLGFHVKGEIGGCDLVGIAEGSPPVVVIGELKLIFNLDLVLQGVDRADVCDEVWLAVRASGEAAANAIRGSASFASGWGSACWLSPNPVPSRLWLAPKQRCRAAIIAAAHASSRSIGEGGAIPWLAALARSCRDGLPPAGSRLRGEGASRLSAPQGSEAFDPDAPQILHRNVYGWFEQIARGVYALTEAGQAALQVWPQSHEQDAHSIPPNV